MLAKEAQVLNFDNSVTAQKDLLLKYKLQILELEELGPAARLWMSKRTANRIRERLKDLPLDRVTFLGSGDFHNISSLLTERIQEPVSLIVFDHHPDWDILPPALGCGSWVTQALRNKNICKCLLMGVSSEDISWPAMQSANLASLQDDRLEIYPYWHGPSRVFLRKVPDNKSLSLKRALFSTEISWSNLKDRDLEDLFRPLIMRLPTKKVYVSIDKDCLTGESALTNWEEGKLSLDQLLKMIRLIRGNLDIVGLDITGEHSRITIHGAVKGLISRLDHPKDVLADQIPPDMVTATNESTNLKIMEALSS